LSPLPSPPAIPSSHPARLLSHPFPFTSGVTLPRSNGTDPLPPPPCYAAPRHSSLDLTFGWIAPPFIPVPHPAAFSLSTIYPSIKDQPQTYPRTTRSNRISAGHGQLMFFRFNRAPPRRPGTIYTSSIFPNFANPPRGRFFSRRVRRGLLESFKPIRPSHAPVTPAQLRTNPKHPYSLHPSFITLGLPTYRVLLFPHRLFRELPTPRSNPPLSSLRLAHLLVSSQVPFWLPSGAVSLPFPFLSPV